MEPLDEKEVEDTRKTIETLEVHFCEGTDDSSQLTYSQLPNICFRCC